MSTWKELKNEFMNDPEFVKAYNELLEQERIVEVLIQARKLRRLTQEELAERSGVHQTDISKMENGIRIPSFKTLKKLADALDVTLSVNATINNVRQA